MTIFENRHGVPADLASAGRSERKARRAVKSTTERVTEAEALLRKRRAELREENELAVLRTVAAERLGGDWKTKHRTAIFDALIADFGLA